MNVIVLLGGPGSGKGTAAEGILKRKPYVHVSTGDMLRAEIANGTALGSEAEVFMSKGDLVPDAMVTNMVRERLYESDEGAHFLLDGYPRNLSQADLLDELLDSHGHRLGRVFYLEASEEKLLQRLGGRRACDSCGAGYHVVNMPPAREGLCDACGSELSIREDDREETIRNRIGVFRSQTEGLIDHYGTGGRLTRIDGNGTADQTDEQFVACMEELGL